VVLIVGLLVVWWLFLGINYYGIANSAIASILFLSNIYFSRGGGYFDMTTKELPFNHIWSLSVEEQFYFIFPFLLLLIFKNKYLKRKKIITLLVGGGILLLLSLYFFFCKNTPTIASLSLILKADTRKPLFAKLGHFQLLFPCLKMLIVLSCCAMSKTRYRLTDSLSRFAEKPYCRNIYLSNGQNRVLKAFCADCQSRS